MRHPDYVAKRVADWEALTSQGSWLVFVGRLTDSARTVFALMEKDTNPFYLSSSDWVVRAHHIELFVNPQVHFSPILSMTTEVDCSTLATHVGRTSLTLEHEVRDVTAGIVDGVPPEYVIHSTVTKPAAPCVLARMRSTICLVDEKTQSAAPLTNPELMREHCRPSIMSSASLQKVEPFNPPSENADGNVHVHEFVVRPSDCDGLSHINNATYFALFNNARIDRLTSLHKRSWQELHIKSALSHVYIEYMGQPGAGEKLCILSWTEDESDDIFMAMLRNENKQIISRCRMTSMDSASNQIQASRL